MRNETKVNTLGRKFAPRFTGPYRILNFISLNKCNIKSVHSHNNKIYLVHTDRLKPCKILIDTYPKFEDIDEDNISVKSDQQGQNESLESQVPKNPTVKTKSVTHNYNLRSSK
jgi:hypothetical protein